MAKKLSLTERIKQWAVTKKNKVTAFFSHGTKGKPARKRFWKRFGQVALTVFLVGVISFTIIGTVLVLYVVKSFDADSYLPELGKMSMDNRSVIYVQDNAGQWVAYQNLLGGNSVWMDLNEIPLHMQNAVIAIEDERFWDHQGVDWKRTVGAVINLAKSRIFHTGGTEYGGSTLTQQLIKVTTQNKDHSIKRKINEILAAIELEKNESTKQQVLEAYLNNMPLTGDLVGVGIGARYYFGKEATELDLAESAVLASITNNPSTYNPYTHPENVRQRQKVVLAKMYQLGMISKDEYLQALNEELVFKSSATHQEIQDYYVDLVVEDVIADLMEEYGYTYNYAENMVYYGGLSIYSAENPAVQAAVEAIYANENNYPQHREKDAEDPQTGFFAVDYDGRVIATVGGRGTKTANRVLNRSTQSSRSPGSSMKPVTAYGPAIYLNLVHYSSMVRDAPIQLPDGKLWPHNYEVKSTPDNGNVLLGVALQKSLNTVAARLVQELTPQRSFDYATNTFQLSTLIDSKAVDGQIKTDIALAPMALGALTDGVTVREMAAAYGVFGSGGYYNKPFSYYKVVQGEDEATSTLLTKGKKSTMVMDSASAYVMVSLMQRVTLYGTASDIGKSWPGWQVYAKTGTSESEKDVYFAGGTAYCSAASWFGYDDNTVLSKTQTGYARKLWNQAMKVIHQNKAIKTFTMPSGVVKARYCTETGLLATDACTSVDVGTYKESNLPETCSHGGTPLAFLDENGSEIVTESGEAVPTVSEETTTSATTSATAQSTTKTEATTSTTASATTGKAEESEGEP